MSDKATRKVKMPFSGKKIELVKCPELNYSEELKCASCKMPQNKLKTALKCCERCKIAHYCSRQCQVKDYPNHKHYCRDTQFSKEPLPAEEKLHDIMDVMRAKISIATENGNLQALKLIQKELTKFLESCAANRIICQVTNVLSIKSFLYLQNDSFWGSQGMISMFAHWLTHHTYDKRVEFLKNGVLQTCYRHDKILFEEFDEAELERNPSVENYRKSMNIGMDDFWGRHWSIKEMFFGPFPVDPSYYQPPKGYISDILNRAPLHVLIALLSFQMKANEMFGELSPDQRRELNQVITVLSKRDSKILERLVNPTEECYNESPACSDYGTNALIILAFPFLGEIPKAREYVLEFMYPGAEIVPAKA